MTTENSENRIVVGVDLTETGDHALRQAMQLSRQMPGTELHVVYVLFTEPGLHDSKRLAELDRDINVVLERVREHVAALGAPPSNGQPYEQEIIFHVRLGMAAEAIHQVAVDVDADMIVVGTHGRRGMEKLILGSVAQELVRSARVPVVVARPKDFGGLEKTPLPDVRRPEEDLRLHGAMRRVHVEFRPRTSHISGLL